MPSPKTPSAISPAASSKPLSTAPKRKPIAAETAITEAVGYIRVSTFSDASGYRRKVHHVALTSPRFRATRAMKDANNFGLASHITPHIATLRPRPLLGWSLPSPMLTNGAAQSEQRRVS